MNREPTLKKALEPFLEGLETNIYYDPAGTGVSALFLAVMYSTKQGSFSPLEEDRQYAKKVVELLLEYGADPTRHEANNPQYATPLSAAKIFHDRGRDPEGIYELLLKHSINSATEAAFEDDSNKWKEGFIKKAKGIHSALMKAGASGKKGLENSLKKKSNLIQSIAEKVYDKQSQKRSEEAKAAADKKEASKPFPEFEDDMANLSDEAKKAIIFGKLTGDNFPKLVPSEGLDKQLKDKIASSLVDTPNPLSSPLIKTLENISSHLKSKPEDAKLWSILLNPKYRNLQKEISNLAGMSYDPKEFTDQLAFIAYYISNNKDLSQLKLKNGSWKNLTSMKALHKPKKEFVGKLTGREIALKSLKKKGPGLSRKDGLKFLAVNLFNGDHIKAEQFLESNEEEVGKLLNKQYVKNFDNDNLLNKFTKELTSIAEKAEEEPIESADDKELTGREIIIKSTGKEGSTLSRSEGIDYLAKVIFKGDSKKADQFFDQNRKEVTQLLNRKYEKTFEEDDLSDLFNGDLQDLVSSKTEKSKSVKVKLNAEQEQAALALQSLKYSKKDSISMVKGKQGDSSKIVLDSLKEAGKNRGGK